MFTSALLVNCCAVTWRSRGKLACAVLISTDKPQDSGEESKTTGGGEESKPQDGGEESKVSTDTIDIYISLSLSLVINVISIYVYIYIYIHIYTSRNTSHIHITIVCLYQNLQKHSVAHATTLDVDVFQTVLLGEFFFLCWEIRRSSLILKEVLQQPHCCPMWSHGRFTCFEHSVSHCPTCT